MRKKDKIWGYQYGGPSETGQPKFKLFNHKIQIVTVGKYVQDKI